MNDPQPPSVPNDRKEVGISGFWLRVFAFLVDETILGAPAFLLGLVFFDQFAQLGSWGRALGFVVSLLYFGLMNSALGGGQTFGKRLAKIRVVDANGSFIPWTKSFARYSILGLPYFLNNAHIPPRFLFGWTGSLLSFLIFGIGLSIIYLIIFNCRNRQSLHDVIIGTYVTKTQAIAGAPKPKIWMGHYVVVTLLLAISIFVPFLMKGFVDKEPFKELLALQTSILRQPEVTYASVFAGKNFFSDSSGTRSFTGLTAAVSLDRRVNNYDQLANRIARAIFENYLEAKQRDRITVTIIYGYDLGIAWANTHQTYNFSPLEWQRRIQSQVGDSP
jgi:uncharacterized RDD family membrane protein YckC